MKVAIECKSPLLQKSLEMFLSSYIASPKHSDIIISDEKVIDNDKYFYISSDKDADLIKPFSKSQLILAIKKKIEDKAGSTKIKKQMDFSILEKRIEALTKEYRENILRAIKAFYE